MKIVSWFLPLLSAAHPLFVDAGASPKDDESSVKALMDWIRGTPGGFINSKIQFDSERGQLIVTGEVEANEPLWTVRASEAIFGEIGMPPKEHPDGPEPERPVMPMMNCIAIEELLASSNPYASYLKSRPRVVLPSSYSAASKRILQEMVETKIERGSFVPSQTLPPEGITDWLDYDYIHDCDKEEPVTEDEKQASLVVIKYGYEGRLVPLMDLLQHSLTGSNVNADVDDSTGDVAVKASSALAAGTVLQLSLYSLDDPYWLYGFPELFRDSEVLEGYPYRMYIDSHDQMIDFVVDVPNGTTPVVTKWLAEYPTRSQLEFLQAQHARLAAYTAQRADWSSIEDERERQKVRAFGDKLAEALQAAIFTLLEDTDDAYRQGLSDVCNVETKQCLLQDDDDNEDESFVSRRRLRQRYTELRTDRGEITYETRVYEPHEIMKFDHYEVVEEIQSPYQQIAVSIRNGKGDVPSPGDDDVCFDLDHIVQICSSYRPQYHEMVVHTTASLVPGPIKRVLWVGGGDSMLLHDMLKYDDLELAVGLELDQRVTRMSMKHFGVSPQFHQHTKVQWWYGDACKSLLMLPAEYFGTFDLVLVDLSETVMSFLVTNELDVFEALSLLLQPNGIMVKNEWYFEKMRNIFHHTLQLTYYEIPIICQQALCFGSHYNSMVQVNATRHPKTDIGKNQDLYLNAVGWDPTKQTQRTWFHDYNHAEDEVLYKSCRKENDPLEEVPENPDKSPGICMVIEAEQVTIDPSQMESTLKSVLERQEFTLLEFMVKEQPTKTIWTLVLEQGYVIARSWKDHPSYVALDVHLWAAFDKQEALKQALLVALGNGSQLASVYRIVAGGMFGTKTYVEDTQLRGPRRTRSCQDDREHIEQQKKGSTGLTQQELISTVTKIMTKETLHGTVLVLCPEGATCATLDLLEEQKLNVQVIPFRDCTGATPTLKSMMQCEMMLVQTLEDIDNKKINGIVIDPAAPMSLGQVVDKVFHNHKYRLAHMEEDNFTMLTVLQKGADEDTDAWKRNMLQRFMGQVIVFDPVRVVDIDLVGGPSPVHIAWISCSDLALVVLPSITEQITQATGLATDVTDIQGGLWRFRANFRPVPFFYHADYDQTDAYEQYQSQTPLEHQTLFQLEQEDDAQDLTCNALVKSLQRAVAQVDQATETPFDLQVVHGMGAGCVIVSHWSEGRALVLWDGKRHVDVNLVLDDPLDMEQTSTEMIDTFGLKKTLRDEQPRGYGRVVSYAKDLLQNKDEPPLWYTSTTSELHLYDNMK